MILSSILIHIAYRETTCIIRPKQRDKSESAEMIPS